MVRVGDGRAVQPRDADRAPRPAPEPDEAQRRPAARSGDPDPAGGIASDKSAPSQMPVARSRDKSSLRIAIFRGSGAEGDRTPDLLSAIQALSQLSYSPASNGERASSKENAGRPIELYRL